MSVRKKLKAADSGAGHDSRCVSSAASPEAPLDEDLLEGLFADDLRMGLIKHSLGLLAINQYTRGGAHFAPAPLEQNRGPSIPIPQGVAAVAEYSERHAFKPFHIPAAVMLFQMYMVSSLMPKSFTIRLSIFLPFSLIIERPNRKGASR